MAISRQLSANSGREKIPNRRLTQTKEQQSAKSMAHSVSNENRRLKLGISPQRRPSTGSGQAEGAEKEKRYLAADTHRLSQTTYSTELKVLSTEWSRKEHRAESTENSFLFVGRRRQTKTFLLRTITRPRSAKVTGPSQRLALSFHTRFALPPARRIGRETSGKKASLTPLILRLLATRSRNLGYKTRHKRSEARIAQSVISTG
jgi:hypothetical protein